jgi:hypothetical protein
MASEKNLFKLEKEIRVKMMNIKSGKLLPKDSGIGKLINMMKSLDEPLYEKIMVEYKGILANIKKPTF